jgi:hypothetical protein
MPSGLSRRRSGAPPAISPTRPLGSRVATSAEAASATAISSHASSKTAGASARDGVPRTAISTAIPTTAPDLARAGGERGSGREPVGRQVHHGGGRQRREGEPERRAREQLRREPVAQVGGLVAGDRAVQQACAGGDERGGHEHGARP